MGQTETTYTRPLTTDACDLAAGDLLNIAVDTRYGYFWEKITGVNLVTCDEDPYQELADEPCEGHCVAILSMESADDADYSYTIHVQYGEAMVTARLHADATSADVAAESKAHDETYAAAFAERVAAARAASVEG